jgi:hypothetical protein
MLSATIDCDIHPGVQGIEALLPYLNELSRESFPACGLDGFDMMSYPPNAQITCRPHRCFLGQRPAMTRASLRDQALGAFGIGTEICNPLNARQEGGQRDHGGGHLPGCQRLDMRTHAGSRA